MKVCILGYGSRGSVYANNFIKFGSVEIAAVCDKRKERLELAEKELNVKNNLYLSEDEFFSQGKLGDLCIVSTQDADHLSHAIKAMQTGYDLLLEKPIAVTEEDCLKIYSVSKQLNRKVFVCHVLRYSPFFATIKNELQSGRYGEVSTINLTENVAYWHQAHSYVRGNWADTKKSSPMILAKCCHDLDILSWFINERCTGISSMGCLRYYTKANAPEGASDRCMSCKYIDACPYSAKTFYFNKHFLSGNRDWPLNVLTLDMTEQGVLSALETSPYGRCVYACDNDAVDHQIVNMQFENRTTAHLTMTAFSDETYREIHVHCERGEIFGNMTDNKLHCNVFGGLNKVIDISADPDLGFGHGGGDYLLVKDIVSAYSGGKAKGLTDIEKSVQSHLMAFAAERSRLENGNIKTVKY